MKRFLTKAFLSTALLFSASSSAEQIVVNVSIKKSFHDKYTQWTANRSCHDFDDYRSEFSHRVTVELLLICKALKLGGLDASLNIVPFTLMGHAIKAAKAGKIDIVGESRAIHTLQSGEFYVSEPVIKKGQIRKGLFGLSSNKALFEVKSLNDLRKFTAISSKKWKVDWSTLEGLDIRTRNSLGDVSKMHKMVEKGRGDFIIDVFPSGSIELLNSHGVELKPIPNVLIALNTSRHFAVPKKSPKSQEIFAALEKGIQVLNEGDEFTKAYTQSGLFNKNVENWTVLKK